MEQAFLALDSFEVQLVKQVLKVNEDLLAIKVLKVFQVMRVLQVMTAAMVLQVMTAVLAKLILAPQVLLDLRVRME
jgi:hypothetical protein